MQGLCVFLSFGHVDVLVSTEANSSIDPRLTNSESAVFWGWFLQNPLFLWVIGNKNQLLFGNKKTKSSENSLKGFF